VRIPKTFVLGLALCACGQPMQSVAPSSQGQALTDNGVPQNGFPNWGERTVLVLTNRVRADPQAALTCTAEECPDKSCYGPAAPVVWNYDLNRAARFHEHNLIASRSDLQHPSPCTLDPSIGSTYPDTCDGSPACACTADFCVAHCGCVQGTDPFDRLGYFFPGTGDQYACAENIAAGYGDPFEVVDAWINESCGPETGYVCSETDCADNQSHRANIFARQNTLMGAGAVPAFGNYCNYGESWWGQDFGCGTVEVPKLVAGTHYPESGTALTFYANWRAPTGPTSAKLDIDGACHDMDVDRGKAGNATYAWSGDVGSGCHRYAFVFADGDGSVTLPARGAYLAGTGCTADWDATAVAPCGGAGSGSSSASSGGSSGGGSGADEGGCTSAGGLSLLAWPLLIAIYRKRRAGIV